MAPPNEPLEVAGAILAGVGLEARLARKTVWPVPTTAPVAEMPPPRAEDAVEDEELAASVALLAMK